MKTDRDKALELTTLPGWRWVEGLYANPPIQSDECWLLCWVEPTWDETGKTITGWEAGGYKGGDDCWGFGNHGGNPINLSGWTIDLSHPSSVWHLLGIVRDVLGHCPGQEVTITVSNGKWRVIQESPMGSHPLSGLPFIRSDKFTTEVDALIDALKRAAGR